MVAVHVDEGLFDKQEPSFHFAVSGKAFAVIIEHFPQLLQKVEKPFPIFTCMKPTRANVLTDAVTLSLHTGALQLLLRATVFARMTPDQKTQLVEVMQGIE